METALKLAGFIGSQGVCSVAQGAVLEATIASTSNTGERKIAVFTAEKIEDGVIQARQVFDANPEQSSNAVFMYDGYVTLPSGKTDALILEVRDYTQGSGTMMLTIPYRNAASPAGFAVYPPKFVSYDGENDLENDKVSGCFSEGMYSHQEAAKIWEEYLEHIV